MPKKKKKTTNMAALPHYPEFNHESKNKAAKWAKYVNRLRNYFTAYNIEDDERKKAMLLTFVGEEVNDIIDELPSEQTTPEKNETHFDKLVLAVQNHFNPENNTEYNRFIFRKKTNHPKHRGLSSGIKRGSSYVPFHRQKCRNKIPANNGLFIRKSSSKGTDEPKHAPRRSNKLCQNDRNHIQTNGTDALRRRQLYYKTYHIH